MVISFELNFFERNILQFYSLNTLSIYNPLSAKSLSEKSVFRMCKF